MFLPYLRAGFFGAPLAPAPIITSSDMQTFADSNNTSTYSTAPLTVSSNRVFMITANSNSATLSGIAGADDTSSAVVSNTSTAPKIYVREMSIVSTLDATWTITYSGSCRDAALGLVVSGMTSVLSPAGISGSGPTLPNHPVLAVTGGPRNVLVVDIMAIRGSHATNPPDPPSGYTLVDVVGAVGTNNPTDNNRPTLAVAQKTYAHTDLSWTGGSANIPTATWQGLENIGTIVWVSNRLTFLS